MKIPFIDLQAQYQAYKSEIDESIQNVLNTSQYIMGPEVKKTRRRISCLYWFKTCNCL